MKIEYTDHSAGTRVVFIGRADYGVKDEKGRAVGGYARLEGPNPSYARWQPNAQDKWALWTGATRNSVSFGASTEAAFYNTEEEARAAAVKKLAAAQKRYQKKYGVQS